MQLCRDGSRRWHWLNVAMQMVALPVVLRPLRAPVQQCIQRNGSVCQRRPLDGHVLLAPRDRRQGVEWASGLEAAKLAHPLPGDGEDPPPAGGCHGRK
eukprot:15167790-Alexandrium_andersonii.AAC.1